MSRTIFPLTLVFFLLCSFCSTTSAEFTKLTSPIVLDGTECFGPGWPQWDIDHLVDGNLSTEYATVHVSNGIWVIFDFGTSQEITGFKHIQRNDWQVIIKSELIFSNDPCFTDPLARVLVDHNAAWGLITIVEFDISVTARYVKWNVLDSMNTADPGAIGQAAGGKEVEFYTGHSLAWNPQPFDKAKYISQTTTLGWSSGDTATSHDVYLGTDYNQVFNATNPDVLPGRGNRLQNSYTTEPLELGQTYYWRIDEVDGGGTDKGPVWQFTTSAFPPTITQPPFYVDSEGNDNNDGSLAHPFATVGRAQAAVGTLISQGLSEDVHVYLRDGTYYLDETLSFDRSDSGTAAYSITYQNYPGEHPIISGGRTITGWQSAGGDLWTTTIPEDDWLGDISLIGYWKLDEDTGDIAYDNSGSSRNGTLIGDQGWQPAGGQIAGALEFDGDDYVEIADDDVFDFASNADFSIAFWFKAPATINSGTLEHFIGHNDGSTGFYIGFHGADNGEISFGTHYGRVKTAQSSWTGGQWYHITVVHSGSGDDQMYVDGVANGVPGDSGYAGPPIAGEPLTLARRSTISSTNYFDGMLDDVRIYERVLTPEEIANVAGWFRQLWCDNSRCQRARWPNPDQDLLRFNDISADFMTITFDQAIPASNLVNYGAELVILYEWSSARVKISDQTSNSVTTPVVCGWRATGNPAENPYGLPNDWNRAWIENHPDLIDQPSEWFLDQPTGTLTYQAPPGVNPNQCNFTAPKLQTLIDLAGDVGNSVRNVVFKGISFRHSGWNLPDFGYAGTGAGCYFEPEVMTIEYYQPPAVKLAYSQDCHFINCSVSNIATTGIAMGQGCKQNQIESCEIYDMGANGIMVGWVPNNDEIKYKWDDYKTIKQTEIANNFIHDCGREWNGGVGLWDSLTQNDILANNIISDITYTGIHAVSHSGILPDRFDAGGITISQNHIHNVMKLGNDGGGIYTAKLHEPQSLFSGNLVYDVQGGWDEIRTTWNHGLYFDHGSENIHIENTITHNIAGADYMLNDCEEEDMTWGTNYWDALPGSWGGAEQAIADAAGTTPTAPQLTLRNYGGGVMLTGQSEAWAVLVDAVIQETSLNVTAFIHLQGNGEIFGAIPLSMLSGTTTATIALRIADPDGEISSPGISNTLTIVPGDINGDNQVDLKDFAGLASNWLDQAPPQPLTIPPANIGWWTFEQAAGSTVFDSSPQGNDGTLVGNAFLDNDPQRSQVLSLDGNGDWVNCDNSSSYNITGEITVMAWIKSQSSKPYAVIVAKGSNSWRLQRFASTDTIEFACTGVTVPENGSGSLLGNISVFDNQWHHLAGVWDGTNMYLYIDGELDVSTTGSGTIAVNSYDVLIGENSQDTGREFTGLIDDVRIYNYAIEQNEIYALSNNDVTCLGDLAGDLDNSCIVDFLDLVALADNWLYE